MANRELYNVLDKLREIAESNDSEDVAAAIEQVDAYSFKGRLAEMEKANSGKVLKENCSSVLSDEEIQIVHQFLRNEIDELPGDMEAKLVDFYADEIPYGWLNGDDGTPQDWLFNKLDMEYGDEVFGESEKVDYDEKDIDDFFGGPDSTKVNEEDPWCLGETPADDDYDEIANKNADERYGPVDDDDEDDDGYMDDEEWEKFLNTDHGSRGREYNGKSGRGAGVSRDEKPLRVIKDNDEGEFTADTGDAFDRISDRVEARGGSEDPGAAADPWGIGDGDEHYADDDPEHVDFDHQWPGKKDADGIEEAPGVDDDQYCAVCGNTGQRLDQADTPCPNCSDEEDEVSALKRVTDRVAQRKGSDQEVEEAVNPVDVKDALKHLYQLLQSGLDPETKEAVQNAYIELKQKAAQEGGQA